MQSKTGLMKDSLCNLVLVLWADHARTRADLAQIAECVARLNPSIQAFVVSHHKFDQLKLLRTWFRPTLSLSFLDLAKRKLLPGRLLTGFLLYKHGEYARLDAAGIPVPQWTIITPDTRLDPDVWGPYVVEKPSVGRRGANVRVRKTTRIRYTAPDAFPIGHYGRDGPMLAQRFVYTGEWPSSYRVITIFGEVLLCYRQISRSRGSPLKGRWGFRETGGVSIVSNTSDMTVELIKDSSIIALAERAHRKAFSDFPILAFDIVRDAETGTLFVLECHAGGSWMFSADVGVGIQAAHDLDFKKQFGAIEKAAEVIARETTRRAVRGGPFAAQTAHGR